MTTKKEFQIGWYIVPEDTEMTDRGFACAAWSRTIEIKAGRYPVMSSGYFYHERDGRYRDAYVTNAARAVMTGRLELDRLALVSYEEARARLKMLPGVGDKVADCVCLYGLGHLEAFPIDVHIRRVLEREYSGAFPFTQFGSFAGLVQQLIFYYERECSANF